MRSCTTACAQNKMNAALEGRRILFKTSWFPRKDIIKYVSAKTS